MSKDYCISRSVLRGPSTSGISKSVILDMMFNLHRLNFCKAQ